MVEAEHYDQEYSTSDWRQAGNVYTVETRRTIEGRHPQVVKEVFNPERVLDMGCGPGILVYLLDEVGVTADGIDFGARHARDGTAGGPRSHLGRRPGRRPTCPTTPTTWSSAARCSST